MSRAFDLVAFDFDGTLAVHPERKTVWELLNRRYLGDDTVNRERYARYRSGEISYREWVSLDIQGWFEAGAHRDEMVETFADLRLVDGAEETVARVSASGARVVIISGTLDLLVESLWPDAPFHEVYTNRIGFDASGRISGWTPTPFDGAGKAVALRSIAFREGVPIARCAFVGDSSNDVDVAREAGFAVAFNPACPELEAASDVVVRSDDLRSVLPHLELVSPADR